ncbi:hypothetical protein L7F22_062122 [Adiantum nelumboides]|nr:hypothetical protein [Adiantum nelumboides]
MEGMEKPRILLFGRTGSGKSTVANMLAHGHLQEPCLFRTSSSVRGETMRMQKEEVDNMVIVDTVGMGESEHGSVSNKEAQDILYNFFLRLADEEGFHYFAFVRKWGRNDLLDEQLWKFFRQAFKGAEKNFVVIFTHFDKGEAALEVPETRELLLQMYHPCERWICVDFPAPDQKLTAALKKVSDRRRARSTARLKEKIAEFFWPQPLAPDVCMRLRVGRVLLLGRRSPAKAFLGNLLVKGNFLKSPTDEEELPFSMSFASVDDQPFKEAKGRRWEVVNFRDFDSYMVKKYERDDDFDSYNMQSLMLELAEPDADVKLALALIEGILTTLMQAEGFSHVVYVHESGQSTVRPGKDELIDKMFWGIILALLSTAIRNERLVLVIAENSRASPSSRKVKHAESARFNDCKNLLHLDIPYIHDDDHVAAEQAMATRDQHWPDIAQHNKASRDLQRLDTAQRIIEQVLQKEVDTQSTVFNLEKLPFLREQGIIRNVGRSFLTPVVKAMRKEPRDRMFRVSRSRALSELSSAYEKIVKLNKQRNDVNLQVRRMWREQTNEEAQEVVWEGEGELAAISSDHGGFCQSRRLVAGKNLDFCYLRMKCNIPVVKDIEVTVESHDQGFFQGSPDVVKSMTWGELAVLAPDGQTQIGKRIRVYTNRHSKVRNVHFKTVTNPLFLQSIQVHHVIALYLCSSPGWCSYTRYASIQLLGP